jgi:RNA polymerase sigma-70 factor (ECF subfamily)
VQTEANGCPAVAQYRPTADGGHAPWALHVLEIDGGRIRHITSFLDWTTAFARLGLPARGAGVDSS